jgi:hypothetical protein
MTEQATTEQTFDAWAILHLFGRHTVAGKLSEQKVFGKDWARLDVPASDGRQARTILYAPDAVYDFEAVDEETARLVASLHPPADPVSVWSARSMLKQGGSQLALGTLDDEAGEYDDEDVDSFPGPVR